jgi:hypothetical protein
VIQLRQPNEHLHALRLEAGWVLEHSPASLYFTLSYL